MDKRFLRIAFTNARDGDISKPSNNKETIFPFPKIRRKRHNANGKNIFFNSPERAYYSDTVIIIE